MSGKIRSASNLQMTSKLWSKASRPLLKAFMIFEPGKCLSDDFELIRDVQLCFDAKSSAIDCVLSVELSLTTTTCFGSKVCLAKDSKVSPRYYIVYAERV